jgi:two-component system, NtrC family, nitrogen regulation sensor histidine kinase NtrY
VNSRNAIDRITKKPAQLVLFFFLLLMLGGLYVYEHYEDGAIKRQWGTIAMQENQVRAAHIQTQFRSYCAETEAKLRLIIDDFRIRKNLPDLSDSGRTELFTYLQSVAPEDIAVEIFDHEKHIIGWAGQRGGAIDTTLLSTRPVISFSDGAIYSYIVVVEPFRLNDTILGYAAGKRLFDVTYPLNNRFISKNTFASSFNTLLDDETEISFTIDDPRPVKPGWLAIPLSYRDDPTILYATYPSKTMEMYLDHTERTFTQIRNVIILLLVLLLSYQLIRIACKRARLLKMGGSILTVWLIRYTLLWLNIPGEIFSIKIFEPVFYASPFGFGLSRSLGDLFLSSISLFITIVVILRNIEYSDNTQSSPKRSVPGSFQNIVGIICVFGVLVLSIRAFVSIIKSTVYDSTLSYLNPATILPDAELLFMMLSLLLIAVSFLLLDVMLVAMIKIMLDRFLHRDMNSFIRWTVLSITLLAGGLVYGLIFTNTLLDQWSRSALILMIVLLTILVKIKSPGTLSQLTTSGMFLLSIGAAIVVVPILTRYVHDYDRSLIEFKSAELLRPESTWLAFLVNTGLDEVSSEDITELIATSRNGDLTKLAFVQWAKSILSREGNDCTLIYYDRDGKRVSNFSIGIQESGRRDSIDIPQNRITFSDEISLNGTIIKWYGGIQPFYDSSGVLVGAVQIRVTGSRETLTRGETPEVLRASDFQKRQSIPYKLIFMEYMDGRSSHLTSEDIPSNRQLPASVLSLPNEKSGLWIDEFIDGKKYESYFFRRANLPDSSIWYSLSREVSDVPIYFYMLLQYYFFYIIFFVILSVIGMGIQRITGTRTTIGFRSRLTISFTVLSILPVIVIAYYNQQYSIERVQKSTVDRLKDQTAIAISELKKETDITIPTGLAAATDEECMMLADDINIDFNLYFLTDLQASSKPEMFTAELIDSNLSANVYLNLFLQKRSFCTESQAIGDLTYIVGYRPVIAQNGTVIGAIAVPSLYRIPEIVERMIQRNVYLYVVYAFSLILSIVTGVILARRISAPIKRLKTATMKIAEGNLDVSLDSDRADELGDLERTFKTMTQRLGAAQTELVKVQKEAAWREMAKQVAHEIKNPLTPIRLSVQHLRQAYKDGVKNFDELLLQITSTILDQIDALSRIATEFSHYARMPQNELETIDVHQIVTEAVNLFKQYEVILFQVRLDANNSMVAGNREEFRRALINILRNAVQALNEHGSVTISTENKYDNLIVSIHDDGPGIPVEIQNHLFEPNFSTKTDGMGLGLAIVKKIITEMHGEVLIESSISAGTTVRIIVPLVTS